MKTGKKLLKVDFRIERTHELKFVRGKLIDKPVGWAVMSSSPLTPFGDFHGSFDTLVAAKAWCAKQKGKALCRVIIEAPRARRKRKEKSQ